MKKGKNTARNNTTAFNKYMPEQPIFQFTKSNKAVEEVVLTNI